VLLKKVQITRVERNKRKIAVIFVSDPSTRSMHVCSQLATLILSL